MPPGAEPGQPLACLALPVEATTHSDATGSSEWNDVLVDWRNRVWLGGYDRGALPANDLGPAGNARGVIRALSPLGEPLFDSDAQLDSPGADAVEALSLSEAGLIFAAGRTSGAFAGQTHRGQFDTFIARGDASQPAAAWRVGQFGDERPQHPRRIATAGTADVYVAGFNADWVPTNYVAEWADASAGRFTVNSAGSGAPVAPAWEHRSLSEAQDFGLALVLHQDHVFIGGTVTGGTQRGAFVRKLALSGAPVWTARYTSFGGDSVAALQRLADGTLLIAGSVGGSFRGGVHRGQQDVYIARINPADGAVLASAQFGTEGTEWLTDAKVDAQGNIFLFGETDGGFVAGQAPAGNADFFLLKVRMDGTLLKSWQWGTADDEHAKAAALDSCGRAVAVGATASGAHKRAVMWFPRAQ
ncbi:MAG: hypothetical protein ACK44A_03190 [Roseateles sp.]